MKRLNKIELFYLCPGEVCILSHVHGSARIALCTGRDFLDDEPQKVEMFDADGITMCIGNITVDRKRYAVLLYGGHVVIEDYSWLHTHCAVTTLAGGR